MFGRVAKIPIANAFSELVEMDFVGYGDLATSLHIQDAFSRFSAIAFLGTKRNEEQTAEMAKESAISDRVAVLGAPEIMMVGIDSRFTGGDFSGFPHGT